MENTQLNEKFRILMIFGVIGPIAAVSLTLIDVGLSPWYSWSTSALSDLGVHQYSYLFNGGLIFEAITNLLFAVGVKKLNVTNIGTAATIAVAGLSLGLVGIFNENYHSLHLTFALIYFIVFPLGIIAFSAGKKNLPGYCSLLGYATSMIGLVFIMIGILQDFNLFNTPFGLGLYELVEAIMLSIWIVYTGAFYYVKSGRKKSE